MMRNRAKDDSSIMNCVTRRLILLSMALWDFGARSQSEPMEELFVMYPSPIRRWIANRFGAIVPRPTSWPRCIGLLER